MTITHGTKQHELKFLLDLFKKLFENKAGDVLETTIYGKLSLYMYHCDDQDLLENFVKEYFKLRGLIVETRNDFIDTIQSYKFKKENLINKFIINANLNYWNKLCKNINKFEKEFFNRTGISLLRVENERWAKEQQAKKEQVVQQ